MNNKSRGILVKDFGKVPSFDYTKRMAAMSVFQCRDNLSLFDPKSYFQS
jgi:hypothetical protein